MIGTYASFKGKLKVGDRVRFGKDLESVITRFDDKYFYTPLTIRSWSEEGTLELLSPSQRVVTDTEAPSLPLIAKFTVKARGSVDYSNIIKMTNPTDKDVYAMVWDASPPAPAEKEEEWWNKYVYRVRETYDFYGVPRDGVEKLVIEAKRRGAEEAWKEMYSVLDTIETGRDVRWPDNVPWHEEGDGWDALKIDMRMAIDAKLESLNKPAGAGEK